MRSQPSARADYEGYCVVLALVGMLFVIATMLVRHVWPAVHGADLPLLPAVLVPLMLPQVGGSVRRALRGDVREVAGPGASPALAEAHAAVCRELAALRAQHLALQQEVAEREAATERLDFLAHHDALTRLPNRVLLMERLNAALTFAKRAETGVLVIYLDVDHFKTINDTLGHAAGDRVLKEIATRIAACMRSADTASRLGGDEFVLVCSTIDGIADAPQVAARVLAAIERPIDVFGTPVTLGASMGISMYPADGCDAHELIEKADAAMYSAKQRGRNGFNVYTPEIQAGIERKLRFEADLRQAIDANEFEVHYQPIVELASRTISGAEALVRWRHPTRGLLAPHEFLPFAETQGLGAEIGELVLQAVCAQLKRFALAADDDFSIAINVSPSHLARTDFAAGLAKQIAANAADPRRLTIEIAQSGISDEATLATTLAEITALGARLAIDDFGVGTGSLSALKRLPVQQLKIDRSFVREIADSSSDQAIATSIVALAHGLGMRVIAEGVETHDQLHMLRALGVDRLQGYVFSAPLPAAQFERFVCTKGALRLAA